MANAEDRLAGYVAAWARCVDDAVALLQEVAPEQWSAPTDLAGWDVHDVAAHLAHLESVLAGGPEDRVEIEERPHVANPLGRYTEQGVVARKERSPRQLITELREAADRRLAALRTDPPTDPKATPKILFTGVDWDWQTLLSNRVIDVWMHEQDIRRAIGADGGLDSPGADHTVATFARALGAVIARRANAPAGTTVVLGLAEGDRFAYRVDESGRAVPDAAPPARPTVRLETDRQAFVCLAGGRRTPEHVRVSIDGKAELAARILAKMVVTP